MPSFAVSTSVLTLVQAALVLLPSARRVRVPRRLTGRWWATLPAASVLVVVFGLRAAAPAAQGLTYLALVAVPVLAAGALAFVSRGARPMLGALALVLFVLAWADRRGLLGQAAALALSGLSCVALGVLLSAVAPSRWLRAGIVVMAVVDSALVVSDLLQAPNDVLNAAAPAAGLPQLQTAGFGSAVMGFGDLFIAGVLGAVLAANRRVQRQGAWAVAMLGLGFNLLFLVVRELPATVPVALALVLVEVHARRGRRRAARPSPALSGPGDAHMGGPPVALGATARIE